jgi:hypothetical protein
MEELQKKTMRKNIKNMIRSKHICNKNGFFINLFLFSIEKLPLVKEFDLLIL